MFLVLRSARTSLPPESIWLALVGADAEPFPRRRDWISRYAPKRGGASHETWRRSPCEARYDFELFESAAGSVTLREWIIVRRADEGSTIELGAEALQPGLARAFESFFDSAILGLEGAGGT